MKIEMTEACRLLQQADDITILTHRKPDGDTLGAGFALLFALEAMGKRARVECPDPLPNKYKYIYGEYKPEEFDAKFVVAVDVASLALLTTLGEKYTGVIDLCIDHHHSNELYAKHSLVEAQAPAACQIMYRVIQGLGVDITKPMADSLYTGLVSDTGGFRFAGVKAETHRIAADLIEYGADFAGVNRVLFETNSPARIQVNAQILESMEYHFDGLCACASVPGGMIRSLGAADEELEGVSSIPRTIEGVMAGVTLFEYLSGTCRCSLRTFSPVDASAICAVFGGGGHANAAGCTIEGNLAEAKEKVLAEVEEELKRRGLLCRESC